ncbi:MAG: RHS repeat protein, partial [Myxococcales bacterium]|nr:RHS repeat protein [Myxococcales bacterium]
MARTAPVPNIPAPPGMNPGAFVAGGGGDGGGGSGKGSKNGSGNEGAGTGEGDEDATGDGNGATGCGDPVCPITGKVFLEFLDFAYAAPCQLRWTREYSSRGSNRSGDLGCGWSHSFSWRVQLRRRKLLVFDNKHREQAFRLPRGSEVVQNAFGWRVSWVQQDLLLRIPGGTSYVFSRVEKSQDVLLLASVLDRHGNRTRIQRNSKGAIQGMRDSAGRAYAFETDGLNRIRVIRIATDASESRWLDIARYAYDAKGNLAEFIDAEGYKFRYQYSGHLLTAHHLPSGLSYCYRYDSRKESARCLETWGEYIGKTDPALDVPLPVRPTGHDNRDVKGIHYRKLTYLPEQNYSEVENGLGGIERYFGDELGRVVRHVTWTGGVREYWHDPDTGSTVRVSDELGDVTEIRENSESVPMGFSSSNGQQMRRTFEPDGSVLDWDGVRGSFVRRLFDDAGNLIYAKYADDTIEEWEYDDRGLMRMYRARSGAVFLYEYDAQGNCVRVLHGEHVLEESEYDYFGRRTLLRRPGRGETRWAYDRRSDIVWKQHADGSVFEVTRNADRKITMLNLAGAISRIEYGGMAWPIRKTAPDGAVTERRYDVEGNLVLLRNARGQEFRQQVDVASAWIRCSTFEGIEYEIRRDELGRPVQRVSPDGIDSREFDAWGRITTAEMPDGETLTLDYGERGLASVESRDTKLGFEYDAIGLVTKDIQGDVEIALDWSGGKLKSVRPPGRGSIDYEHDSLGQLRELLVEGNLLRLHDPEGDSTLTYLRGVVLRQRRSVTGTLVEQRVARLDVNIPEEKRARFGDPGSLFGARYEYNARQVLTRIIYDDGTLESFVLDACDRIVKRVVERAGRTLVEERIGYDRAGSPRVEGATYDALFRPSGYAGETFSYDTSGRLIERLTDRGAWKYEWDTHDNLVRVESPTARITLRYDGRGRRCEKLVERDDQLLRHVTYVWSNDALIYEIDHSSGATRAYLRDNRSWFPMGHVDITDQARPVLYVLDPSNAPVMAVDAGGTVVWQATRSVFGVVHPSVDVVDVSARFPNQYYDPDVELIYNRMRWYDPRVGMYVSPDPLLLKGTFNPRDYVPNPFFASDPKGQIAAPSADTPGPTHPPPTGWDRPDRPETDADMNEDYMT